MYTKKQAKQIWKAGQEYGKTSGSTITFEELTERMDQYNKKKEEREDEIYEIIGISAIVILSTVLGMIIAYIVNFIK